jgi:hypothetical protein
MQVTPSKFQYVKLPGLDYELVAVTTDEGRVYTTPSGKQYPSASTVAGILNREAIAKWRLKVGNEEANKISKKGCDRGTAIHLICEKYLLGTLTPFERIGMMPTSKELFLQLKSQFDAHIDVVYGIETPLYSDRLRIAGRTDGIVRWDNKITILDTKTANKPKPEAWITNYFVQTAAYAEMLEERTGMKVDNIVIAMAVEGEIRPTVYQKSKQEYLPILDKCLETFYKEHTF